MVTVATPRALPRGEEEKARHAAKDLSDDPLFTRTRAMVRLSVTLVLLSLGTAAAMREPRAMPVSYTHLTLPTILRV